MTLKPQQGQSRLQRNFSRSLRTIRCWPPPLFPGGFGFAGVVAGAGGTVALSRAVISSLVSFSLGLDRPSSAFLLVMFPPCLSFPRFGSDNRRYVYVHSPAFRAFRTVFS